MLQVSYKVWSSGYKEVVNERTEAEAKQLHEARESYKVFIEEDGKPYSYITVDNDFFSVMFLDHLQRDGMNYTFTERQSGRLFLEKVQGWKYQADTDKKMESIIFYFDEDGKVTIRNADLVSNEVRIFESKEKLDVSSFYEPYPEFGKYEHLIKADRYIPEWPA
jgi:sugar/nucleoside kinase (ribokinase family)